MNFRGRTPKNPLALAGIVGLSMWFLAQLVAQVAPRSIASSAPLRNIVNADFIRVGISDDEMNTWEYPSTRISCKGSFRLLDKSTSLPLLTALPGEVLTFTANNQGLIVKSSARNNFPNNLPMNPAILPLPLPPVPSLNLLAVPPHVGPTGLMPLAGPLRLEPVDPADHLKIISITRRKVVPEFRGALEITRSAASPGKLSVVNVLWMEDYLKAVVPNELPMRYGVEAVKAQSIAARNYALHPREKPWKAFDICDSQLCQVYFGAQTETPDSNRAIAGTEGLVALYDGKPILALFSSSHGGYAENYSNAFSDPLTKQYPAPPIPYLSGGPDIPLTKDLDLRNEADARRFWTDHSVQSFDVDSPYYRWTKSWSRAELETTLNHGLAEVSRDGSTRNFISPLFKGDDSLGEFKSVQVKERGVSGKAMVVQIEGSKGSWTIKKEFLIRKVFKKDGKMLPSANVVFTPHEDGKGHFTGLTAQGGGFGHGVGLSQLGASWMNKHGFGFPQIIQHYYKGVTLGTLPLSTGAGASLRPMMTRFAPIQPRATLWVTQETGETSWNLFHKPSPVTLQLNGKPIQVSVQDKPRTSFNVDGLIHPGELNTLVLLPDEKHPERRVTAWLELYSPQAVIKPAETPVIRSSP